MNKSETTTDQRLAAGRKLAAAGTPGWPLERPHHIAPLRVSIEVTYSMFTLGVSDSQLDESEAAMHTNLPYSDV